LLLLEVWYRDDAADTIEEISSVFSNLNALVAASKDMQPVKLCSNKILQLLTGVQVAQVDMYNGFKTVILLAVISVIIIVYRPALPSVL